MEPALTLVLMALPALLGVNFFGFLKFTLLGGLALRCGLVGAPLLRIWPVIGLLRLGLAHLPRLPIGLRRLLAAGFRLMGGLSGGT